MVNRAWVNVRPELLAELLGLSKGARIVRADMNGWDFNLRLGIEGPGLPESHEGESTPEITIVARFEIVDGVRRVFGSYSHDPKNEWLVYERLEPKPSDVTLFQNDEITVTRPR